MTTTVYYYIYFVYIKLKLFITNIFSLLQILYKLLQNVQQHKQAAQSFYVSYFTDILQHVFSVATDTSHTASKIYLLIYVLIVIFKIFFFKF